MIYEYRVYETVPGRLPALHERFRSHTLRIFERVGMRVVGFFTPDLGGSTDQLAYILAFDDLAHLERAWGAFREDAEWKRVKAESELDGPIVARVISQVWRPTDYSPLG